MKKINDWVIKTFGLRMFMMRNAIIMSLMNALRYTGSSVDAPPP